MGLFYVLSAENWRKGKVPITKESLLRAVINNSCSCINCDNDLVEEMTFHQDSLEETVTCRKCNYSWRNSLTTVVIDQIRGPDGRLLPGDVGVKFLGNGTESRVSNRFTHSKKQLLASLMAARFLVEYFKNPSLEFCIRDKSKIIAMMDRNLPMVDMTGMTPEKAFEILDTEAWTDIPAYQ